MLVLYVLNQTSSVSKARSKMFPIPGCRNEQKGDQQRHPHFSVQPLLLVLITEHSAFSIYTVP